MSGKDESLLDRVLYGVESVTEVFRIFHGRNLVTQLVQGLGEGGTTQLQGIEREVYIINVCILVLSYYRRDDFLDIANLGTGGDNHRTRGDHLIVTVLLRHG